MTSYPPLVIRKSSEPQSFISYPFVGALEDMDLLNFYRPITKWNAVVHDRGRVAELVHRAFREATSGRPGPVHLDIPVDILCEPGPAADLPDSETYRPTGRLRGDAKAIERAVQVLHNAERPILVAGGGVVASLAWTEFRALVDALDVPATITPTGAFLRISTF